MKIFPVRFEGEAEEDILQIWRLIAANDGDDRALRVVRGIQSFCLSLGEFPHVGSRHEDIRPGLRAVPLPRFSRVTVAYVVGPQEVVVLRVGYLGRNILADIAESD